MAKKQVRVSISKKQQEEQAGAELLELCQAISDDGVVSKSEIIELIKWLNEHKSAELPAIGYLKDIVKRIAADGVITKEERQELQLAIEKVLPPDYRKHATKQRKTLEWAERKRKYEKERRNTPIDFRFQVAGTAHEGRKEIIERYVRIPEKVKLIRDKHNQYSTTAVKVVLTNGKCIGFVPKLRRYGEEDSGRISEEVAELLDEGRPYEAELYDIWVGDVATKPKVRVTMYPVGTSRKEVKAEEKRTRTSASPFESEPNWDYSYGNKNRPVKQTGCLSIIFFLVIGLTMLYQIGKA